MPYVEDCACLRCSKQRGHRHAFMDGFPKLWRYACELCGNKRCNHHSDHDLECTKNNEPRQTGSVFQ